MISINDISINYPKEYNKSCILCNNIYKSEEFHILCKKMHKICNNCYKNIIQTIHFDNDLYFNIQNKCPICMKNIDQILLPDEFILEEQKCRS